MPHKGRYAAGFPALCRPDAKTLLLGSLPGAASIAAGEYYAHPRNAFWPIMARLAGASGDYAARCTALLNRRIALWDVLAGSVRAGSMDAAIDTGSAIANDFTTFFEHHPRIAVIGFNGRKAEQLYRRLVLPSLAGPGPRQLLLPSTSPTYAAMSFEQKLNRWRRVLTAAEDEQ